MRATAFSFQVQQMNKDDIRSICPGDLLIDNDGDLMIVADISWLHRDEWAANPMRPHGCELGDPWDGPEAVIGAEALTYVFISGSLCGRAFTDPLETIEDEIAYEGLWFWPPEDMHDDG